MKSSISVKEMKSMPTSKLASREMSAGSKGYCSKQAQSRSFELGESSPPRPNRNRASGVFQILKKREL
jgi:hypothetical protein